MAPIPPGGPIVTDPIPKWVRDARLAYSRYYDKELNRLNTLLGIAKRGKKLLQIDQLTKQINTLKSTYQRTYYNNTLLKAWWEKQGGTGTKPGTGTGEKPGTGTGDGTGDAGDDAAAAAAKAAADDAYALLKGMLDKWGLGSLAGTVLGLAQKGYTVNQILLQLRDTDAYKKRFKGNEERIKNGYAALDPDEYLSVEDAFQRILQSYGLPKGFYDSNDDFAGWIGANVSAAEIENRAQMASDAVNNSDPWKLEALRLKGMTHGDMVSFWLDQKRALPILKKIEGTAKLGAAALRYGLNFDQARADQWYDRYGGQVSQQEADRAYSIVAQGLPLGTKLGTIWGEGLNQGDLEDEALGNSELAAAKRRRVALNETNAFAGTGATGDKSLNQRSRGEF